MWLAITIFVDVGNKSGTACHEVFETYTAWSLVADNLALSKSLSLVQLNVVATDTSLDVSVFGAGSVFLNKTVMSVIVVIMVIM